MGRMVHRGIEVTNSLFTRKKAVWEPWNIWGEIWY